MQKCTASTNTSPKYRNKLQILKMQLNKEKHLKYSQHNEIQKRAANIHIATKYRNGANTHNTTKYRNTLQTQQTNTETRWKYSQHNGIKKRAANIHNTTTYRNVCFCILCCEYLKYMCCQSDEDVFLISMCVFCFVFVCVFFSCSVLSSLSHNNRPHY